MGWNDAAAVAKREVISSGVIEVCDSRYEAAVIAAGRCSGVGGGAPYEAAVLATVCRSGNGNLRRYEEEHEW